MKIAVLGSGAWGTALANLLCQNNNDVTLWGRNAEQLRAMEQTGGNERYLPGIRLHPALRFQPGLAEAANGSEMILVAVPSRHFREVVSQLRGTNAIAVTVTKGIEDVTGLTMCGILNDVLPNTPAVALSGPTLAMEVAREIPAAIVAAHAEESVAKTVQQLFHRPYFRVYTSTDVIGVELGGALKNVVAIAAGIGDGIGFGDNTKAALITRAIAEIRRLGVRCGALPVTFSGLSGLGDLTVTCFSKLSRNRQFGERIGRGESVAQILASVITVAEGYPTALSAQRLAKKMGVETPIIEEVHAMLYQQKDVRKAVYALMSREMKSED